MKIERRGKIMSLIPVLNMACGERLDSHNDGRGTHWPLVGCIPALVLVKGATIVGTILAWLGILLTALASFDPHTEPALPL